MQLERSWHLEDALAQLESIARQRAGRVRHASGTVGSQTHSALRYRRVTTTTTEGSLSSEPLRKAHSGGVAATNTSGGPEQLRSISSVEPRPCRAGFAGVGTFSKGLASTVAP